MYVDLLRSLLARPGRRRRRAWSLGLVGIGLLTGVMPVGVPEWLAGATEGPAEVSGSEPPELAILEWRVRRVRSAWSEVARYYDSEVAPIERVLLRYRNDRALAGRIAVALVRESNRLDLNPRLLLAVLLVENPWLDPSARSPVGAVGLMQVMPVHRGSFPGCGSDLEDVDANICYGAHIFARYFRDSGGDVDRALLHYNGCVHGTNTPACRQYPTRVFARAGRASLQAWLGVVPAAGSR